MLPDGTGGKTMNIQSPAEEDRPWGRFIILDEGSGFKVKRIEVKPGLRLSLQSHEHRQEFWTIVAGTATVTLDSEEHVLQVGESIKIPLHARHRVQNPGTTKMMFVEVQTGDYLGEDDIKRYEDDFDRA